MGVLCKRDGPEIYVSTKDTILEGVKSNLERRPIGEAGISEQMEAEKLADKLAGSSPKVCLHLIPTSVAVSLIYCFYYRKYYAPQGTIANAEEIFHDTAGWKSLETWMK